jgi:hypothetical protein
MVRKSWRIGRCGRSSTRSQVARISLGVLTAAIALGTLFSSAAAAAGDGDCYGGAPSPLSGGFVSTLVAKEIAPTGGKLASPVHHALLAVTVPPEPSSHVVQYLVTLGDQSGKHRSTLIDFSVLAQGFGSRASAAPVTISYSSRNVSSDTRVVSGNGRFESISSSVTGDTVTFTALPDQAFEILGRG